MPAPQRTQQPLALRRAWGIYQYLDVSKKRDEDRGPLWSPVSMMSIRTSSRFNSSASYIGPFNYHQLSPLYIYIFYMYLCICKCICIYTSAYICIYIYMFCVRLTWRTGGSGNGGKLTIPRQNQEAASNGPSCSWPRTLVESARSTRTCRDVASGR